MSEQEDSKEMNITTFICTFGAFKNIQYVPGFNVCFPLLILRSNPGFKNRCWENKDIIGFQICLFLGR